MALDPRISLGVQPLQMPDPLAQYGKVAAIQQAQNQNALAQYQLSAAQRSDEQAANRLRLLQGAGSDPIKVYNALLESGDIEGAAKFAKGEADVGKTRAETGDIRAKTIAKHMELSKERLAQVRTPEDYLAWHQSNHADPVLNDYFKPLGITAESQTQKILQQLQQPGGFENLFKQSALGLEKSMEQVLTSQRLGGTERVLSTPKYAMPGTVPQATVVPGSVGQVTMTPGEKANVGLRREELELKKETEKRLASGGVAGGDTLIAQAIRDGRLDLSQVTSKNKTIIASTLQNNPDYDFRTSGVEFMGAKAGSRTLGTSEAKMVQAASEATEMMNITRQLIPTINPTDYPLLNQAGNYVARNSGNPAQVGFATALNGLVNTYARAINPTGVPTVSDKQHARKAINSAMSSGQLNEALRVMQLEMDAALASPAKARKALGHTKEAEVPGERKPAAVANSVKLPDGRVMTFPNAEAAAKFKKDAGL